MHRRLHGVLSTSRTGLRESPGGVARRRLPGVAASLALVVTMSGPAFGQGADRAPDVDRDRAAAEETRDHGRRLAWFGMAGAGLSLAATFMSDERKTSRTGTALGVGGVTALGLGLIGDFARYRARSRLDALDRRMAGAVGSPAHEEAERALRQGRRLSLVGDVGIAMGLATAFLPEQRLDTPAGRSFLYGAVAAAGIGIVGLIKTSRAESRLEAFDEAPQASHRVGVAPLPDGVAANYSVAW